MCECERVEYAIECVCGTVYNYRRDKVKDGQRRHNDQNAAMSDKVCKVLHGLWSNLLSQL